MRESDTGEKAQMEAKVKNAIAVHYLMLSMNEEEHMGVIDDVRTGDWPSMLVCEIWNIPEEENMPNDTLAKAELMKKIMQLKLKKNASLKKLGKELTALKSRYNCRLDKEQNITAVVTTAGRDYAETIQQETLILGIKTQPVTARTLIKAMHEKWRIGGGGDEDDTDEPNEAALTAVPGTFNGICYKFG